MSAACSESVSSPRPTVGRSSHTPSPSRSPAMSTPITVSEASPLTTPTGAASGAAPSTPSPVAEEPPILQNTLLRNGGVEDSGAAQEGSDGLEELPVHPSPPQQDEPLQMVCDDTYFLHELIQIAVELKQTLSPSTEKVLRLRTALSGLLDDLRVLSSAKNSELLSCTPRLVMTARSGSDVGQEGKTAALQLLLPSYSSTGATTTTGTNQAGYASHNSNNNTNGFHSTFGSASPWYGVSDGTMGVGFTGGSGTGLVRMDSTGTITPGVMTPSFANSPQSLSLAAHASPQGPLTSANGLSTWSLGGAVGAAPTSVALPLSLQGASPSAPPPPGQGTPNGRSIGPAAEMTPSTFQSAPRLPHNTSPDGEADLPTTQGLVQGHLYAASPAGAVAPLPTILLQRSPSARFGPAAPASLSPRVDCSASPPPPLPNPASRAMDADQPAHPQPHSPTEEAPARLARRPTAGAREAALHDSQRRLSESDGRGSTTRLPSLFPSQPVALLNAPGHQTTPLHSPLSIQSMDGNGAGQGAAGQTPREPSLFGSTTAPRPTTAASAQASPPAAGETSSPSVAAGPSRVPPMPQLRSEPISSSSFSVASPLPQGPPAPPPAATHYGPSISFVATPILSPTSATAALPGILGSGTHRASAGAGDTLSLRSPDLRSTPPRTAPSRGGTPSPSLTGSPRGMPWPPPLSGSVSPMSASPQLPSPSANNGGTRYSRVRRRSVTVLPGAFAVTVFDRAKDLVLNGRVPLALRASPSLSFSATSVPKDCEQTASAAVSADAVVTSAPVEKRLSQCSTGSKDATSTTRLSHLEDQSPLTRIDTFTFAENGGGGGLVEELGAWTRRPTTPPPSQSQSYATPARTTTHGAAQTTKVSWLLQDATDEGAVRSEGGSRFTSYAPDTYPQVPITTVGDATCLCVPVWEVGRGTLEDTLSMLFGPYAQDGPAVTADGNAGVARSSGSSHGKATHTFARRFDQPTNVSVASPTSPTLPPLPRPPSRTAFSVTTRRDVPLRTASPSAGKALSTEAGSRAVGHAAAIGDAGEPSRGSPPSPHTPPYDGSTTSPRRVPSAISFLGGSVHGLATKEQEMMSSSATWMAGGVAPSSPQESADDGVNGTTVAYSPKMNGDATGNVTTLATDAELAPATRHIRALRQAIASHTFFVLTHAELVYDPRAADAGAPLEGDAPSATTAELQRPPPPPSVGNGSFPSFPASAAAGPRWAGSFDEATVAETAGGTGATTSTPRRGAPSLTSPVSPGSSAPSPLAPPPLVHSLPELVTGFCEQVRRLFQVEVAEWQVIPFSGRHSLVTRDLLASVVSVTMCSQHPAAHLSGRVQDTDDGKKRGPNDFGRGAEAQSDAPEALSFTHSSTFTGNVNARSTPNQARNESVTNMLSSLGYPPLQNSKEGGGPGEREPTPSFGSNNSDRGWSVSGIVQVTSTVLSRSDGAQPAHSTDTRTRGDASVEEHHVRESSVHPRHPSSSETDSDMAEGTAPPPHPQQSTPKPSSLSPPFLSTDRGDDAHAPDARAPTPRPSARPTPPLPPPLTTRTPSSGTLREVNFNAAAVATGPSPSDPRYGNTHGLDSVNDSPMPQDILRLPIPLAGSRTASPVSPVPSPPQALSAAVAHAQLADAVTRYMQTCLPTACEETRRPQQVSPDGDCVSSASAPLLTAASPATKAAGCEVNPLRDETADVGARNGEVRPSAGNRTVLSEAVLQHAMLHMWPRCGAARLLATFNGFERNAYNYLLSQASMSLMLWSAQLAPLLPAAATTTEQRLQKTRVKYESLVRRISHVEVSLEKLRTTAAPAMAADLTRTRVQETFTKVAEAFLRDLRVMVVLQEDPRELDIRATPELAAAHERMRRSVSAFKYLYVERDWETSYSAVQEQTAALQRRHRARRTRYLEEYPSAQTELALMTAQSKASSASGSSQARSPLAGLDRSQSTPHLMAFPSADEVDRSMLRKERARELANLRARIDEEADPGYAHRLRKLTKIRTELERQLVVSLSQLNTEIINLFTAVCAAQMPYIASDAEREVEGTVRAYRAFARTLERSMGNAAKASASGGAKGGNKKHGPTSGGRRTGPSSAASVGGSSFYGAEAVQQRQNAAALADIQADVDALSQLPLLSLAPLSRLQPFITALRATLCEDQVRALAKVRQVLESRGGLANLSPQRAGDAVPTSGGTDSSAATTSNTGTSLAPQTFLTAVGGGNSSDTLHDDAGPLTAPTGLSRSPRTTAEDFFAPPPIPQPFALQAAATTSPQSYPQWQRRHNRSPTLPRQASFTGRQEGSQADGDARNPPVSRDRTQSANNRSINGRSMLSPLFGPVVQDDATRQSPQALRPNSSGSQSNANTSNPSKPSSAPADTKDTKGRERAVSYDDDTAIVSETTSAHSRSSISAKARRRVSSHGASARPRTTYQIATRTAHMLRQWQQEFRACGVAGQHAVRPSHPKKGATARHGLNSFRRNSNVSSASSFQGRPASVYSATNGVAEDGTGSERFLQRASLARNNSANSFTYAGASGETPRSPNESSRVDPFFATEDDANGALPFPHLPPDEGGSTARCGGGGRGAGDLAYLGDADAAVPLSPLPMFSQALADTHSLQTNADGDARVDSGTSLREDTTASSQHSGVRRQNRRSGTEGDDDDVSTFDVSEGCTEGDEAAQERWWPEETAVAREQRLWMAHLHGWRHRETPYDLRPQHFAEHPALWVLLDVWEEALLPMCATPWVAYRHGQYAACLNRVGGQLLYLQRLWLEKLSEAAATAEEDITRLSAELSWLRGEARTAATTDGTGQDPHPQSSQEVSGADHGCSGSTASRGPSRASEAVPASSARDTIEEVFQRATAVVERLGRLRALNFNKDVEALPHV